MRKNRRKFVRIVSFLTAFVVTLAIWGGVSTYKLSVVKRQVKASQERALTQFGTYMDEIDLNLQKCMYSSGKTMLSDIASDLWRSSASAKASLSEITDGNTEISGIYKFLSQVGEYTLSLNNKLASGKAVSKEETENLKKLKEYSRQISESVNYLIEQEENGFLDFEEVKTTLQSEGSDRLYLSDELNDTNQAIQDYPTLIYDGPFSDHIDSKESSVLKDLDEISQQKAQERAASFLGIKSEELYFLCKTSSNMSTYTFYNTTTTISVTQKGGLISSMLSSSFAGESRLTTEQAIEKATEFLKKVGYQNIKESYYSTNDGICTINFAYYEDGIIYYTDLIKVSIALDDGAVTAFDSTGYLMNHKKRSIPENVNYTLESGATLLNSNLQVLSAKKAVIPTEWETEVYVYEYRCKAEDDQEILVYIDPVTGEEKDILILLYSDGGVLTK